MPIKTRTRRSRTQGNVDELLSLKRQLAQTMRSKKMTVAGLAKKLGTGRTAIRRVLDEKSTAITFKTIHKTAEALGLKVVLKARRMSPEELGALAHQMVE